LTLIGNNITGSLPSSIGDLHNLEMLSVSEMKMSGIIPNSAYTLRKLKVLDLAKNSPGFEGTISTEIGNLRSLERLILFDNTLLSGTLPSELGKCTNLSEL
jgi:Leucine-rich repeat (LRR) protein